MVARRGIIRMAGMAAARGAVAVTLLSSCVQLALPEGFFPAGEESVVRVRFGVGVPTRSTKAGVLSGAADVLSGAMVLVFRSEGGRLVGTQVFSSEELTSGRAELDMSLPACPCDFYVLGNLFLVSRSDGSAVSLLDALGPEQLATREAVEGLVYRMDGSVWNQAFRQEGAGDVARLGIPFRYVGKGVNPRDLADGNIPDGFLRCRFLFARVRVRVCRDAFDAGDDAVMDWFRGESLSVRQANARLYPFSDAPVRAESAADVVGRDGETLGRTFDYDPWPESGRDVEYVFYVPENMQGDLLSSDGDPSGKTPSGLSAVGLGDRAVLCTYIEFRGAADRFPGGYGMEGSWRFYLGSDSVGNFDVKGGCDYEVTLSFRLASVFSEPSWKVSCSVDDRRELYVTADAAGRVPVSVADPFDVDGELRLYPHFSYGSGDVGMDACPLVGNGWEPEDLSDVAWTCDFLPVSGSSAGEGERWLSECGLSCVYDGGCLVFRLEDEESYADHYGESRVFSLTLLPGGKECASFCLSLDGAPLRSLLPEFSVSASSVYEGDDVRVVCSPEGALPDGVYCYLEYGVDGGSKKVRDLSPGVSSVSLSGLGVGEHEIDLAFRCAGGRPVRRSVVVEVAEEPGLEVTFGFRSTPLMKWTGLADEEGNQYVAHRLSGGNLLVDLGVDGRYDSVSYTYSGLCAAVVSSSAARMELRPSALGEGRIRAVFRFGASVREKTVPYYVYEEYVLKAAESHNSNWIWLSNNIYLGWKSAVQSGGTTAVADVTWDFSVSVVCTDGTRTEGSWGPYTDSDCVVGDGSEHLRLFHDEFKELRRRFTASHSWEDADHLEGRAVFTVSCRSPYVITRASGATFADIAGMVEGEATTVSACPLLRHFEECGGLFYRMVE